MLNFVYTKAGLELVTSNVQEVMKHEKKGDLVINRTHMNTFDDAETVAKQATEKTGVLYIPVDQGTNCWPQYDVIQSPAVGDKISYSFNGDSYPDGEITKISDSLRRIESNTGSVYWRRRNSGTWLRNKTWSMVSGHVNERNPSF